MVVFLVFLLEFIILSLLSRKLTAALSTVLPYQLLAILFFPGVIIHELSHFLAAGVLFVPVSDMEFVPKMRQGSLKLGSVSIGKTDPFRRTVIGVAPVIAGLACLFTIAFFLSQNSLIIQVILLYLVFAIGNTMFSSPKDMEGFLEVVLFLAFIAMVIYIFTIISGAKLPLGDIGGVREIGEAGGMFTPLVWVLAVVVGIDVVVIGITSALNRR